MLRRNTVPLIGTLGVLVILLSIGLFLPTGEATAQLQNRSSSLAPQVNYRASYINEIRPTANSSNIREVIPFPNTSVFLVRTDKTISVWDVAKHACFA